MPKPGSQVTSTYSARRRWTVADAREVLAAQERSGLELSAFARREGLDPQRLWRWRRQLAAPTAPFFEEVARPELTTAIAQTAGLSSGAERFEIVLSSGLVVRVPASYEATALRRLLVVVREAGPC